MIWLAQAPRTLQFSGFEVKGNESKAVCEHIMSKVIKNSLNVDIEESEQNSQNQTKNKKEQ